MPLTSVPSLGLHAAAKFRSKKSSQEIPAIAALHAMLISGIVVDPGAA